MSLDFGEGLFEHGKASKPSPGCHPSSYEDEGKHYSMRDPKGGHASGTPHAGNGSCLVWGCEDEYKDKWGCIVPKSVVYWSATMVPQSRLTRRVFRILYWLDKVRQYLKKKPLDRSTSCGIIDLLGYRCL